MACASPGGDDCPVGGLECPCTLGGSCDGDLACLEGVCRPITNATDTADTSGPTSASGTNATMTSSDPTSSSATMTSAESSTTDDIKLDVGTEDIPVGKCTETGCKSIDMLFALDSSLSMSEEIDALSNTNAFEEIIAALENVNCGNIDYRIGVTNDNDGGWIGAAGATWFDSQVLTAEEIADRFYTAASMVLGNGGTDPGCEHVLNSAADLLASDTTSFVREDALLLLVLVTDVDDFGAYDQQGFGGPCDGFLCTQNGADPMTIYDNIVGLKGGDAAGVATIVVAGDPTVEPEGMNFCEQPAVCCGGGGKCGQAFPAPRLWEFADLQAGMNGYTANICDGAALIPTAVETALESNIDLACQSFEPEG